MTDIRDNVFTEEQWQAIHRHLKLPPRQQQVVEQLFYGHSDKQIAEELDIAIATVRAHLQRLFNKLSVQDRTELVLLVIRTHLDPNTNKN